MNPERPKKVASQFCSSRSPIVFAPVKVPVLPTKMTMLMAIPLRWVGKRSTTVVATMAMENPAKTRKHKNNAIIHLSSFTQCKVIPLNPDNTRQTPKRDDEELSYFKIRISFYPYLLSMLFVRFSWCILCLGNQLHTMFPKLCWKYKWDHWPLSCRSPNWTGWCYWRTFGTDPGWSHKQSFGIHG